MLALYRGDRQADALELYRQGRHRLVEELGLEPSGSLRQLHEQILTQDPALGATARTHRPPRRAGCLLPVARRPRALVLAGVALLAAALGVGAVQALRGDEAPQRPTVRSGIARWRRARPRTGSSSLS